MSPVHLSSCCALCIVACQADLLCPTLCQFTTERAEAGDADGPSHLMREFRGLQHPIRLLASWMIVCLPRRISSIYRSPQFEPLVATRSVTSEACTVLNTLPPTLGYHAAAGSCSASAESQVCSSSSSAASRSAHGVSSRALTSDG